MNEVTVTYKGVAEGIKHEMFEGKDVGCLWREGCIEVFGDNEGLVIPIERLIEVIYHYRLDNHKD